MNSQMADVFIAIPPKKYQDELIPTADVELAPLNVMKQNMVVLNGTRNPRRPSKVGFPNWLSAFPGGHSRAGVVPFGQRTQAGGEIALCLIRLEEETFILSLA